MPRQCWRRRIAPALFPTEIGFVEDRSGPPSRAYLKLWEALTVIGCRPGPGERCLDLGSSPGGWSWALQRMGAHVVSVDKAPLAPDIARLPGIEHRLESAFALDPRAIGPIDWVFSDVVCYPARLLALIERWLAPTGQAPPGLIPGRGPGVCPGAGSGLKAHGTCRRFVCTLKFQGATDHDTARRFAAIPGSQLRHLFHNKHELTWIKIG